MSIYYFSEQIGDNKTAGSKARIDAEKILKKRDMIPLFPYSYIGNNHLKKIYKILSVLGKVREQDYILIQYPLPVGFNPLLKVIEKRKKVILLVHDIATLRYDGNVKKEIKRIKSAKYIISHNTKMTDFFIKQGIAEEKIINLEIFDYLIDIDSINDHINDREEICFAGNLEKSKFIYKLDSVFKQIKVNLYGIGFNKNKKYTSLNYNGAYPSSIIHCRLKGKYGLVWDGPSTKTCEGYFGKYLSINNPHKVSMYIVAKLPIIIWKNAAMADLVKKYKIGITISNLNELENKLRNITPDDYTQMVNNELKLRKKIIKGYFLNKALDKIQ
ncbi:hypothetical protein [Lactobacillus sp. PV034]|uniref:hypothetical protein n=1 Tax=Lactobacillus sp. PV034 TaxID=2594495 RepID=UPI00223FA08E|nr:hypothetical protein [Lactobacillus sp. PV034]QNQ80525.1 hypothetical protein FP432_02640 [Lactobacillus sp. PV034]